MSHHGSARLTLILGLALALTCSIAAADGSAGAAALVREQVSRGLEAVVRDTETIASDREHARAILERC
ncbi:MAG: hypothetical protein U5L11_08450 [Arhodomonas sp.]|nr:hypothetical protein [Arhodomonas sp.]